MTYKDLFFLLIENKHDSKFIKNILCSRKNLQEPLFVIFVALNLIKIEHAKDYSICLNGFNSGHCDYTKTQNFWNMNVLRGGSASDLTLYPRDNSKLPLICFTAKNRSANLSARELETSQIRDVIKINYGSFKDNYLIGLVVRTKSQVKKIHKSSKYLYQNVENKYIFDNEDLNNCWYYFRNDPLYNLNYNFSNHKQPFNLRLHQKFTIQKTETLLNFKEDVLWGHIPRSGKSFMIAGLIRNMILKETMSTHNFAIIVASPNEAIPQYKEIFEEFSGFEKIKILKIENRRKINLGKNNLFLISKQFIDKKSSYSSQIPWLKEVNWNILFVDEAHFAGSTPLSQKVYSFYFPKVQRIFITATYSKPASTFNITSENTISWDMEDLHYAKSISTLDSQNFLIAKYGLEFEKTLLDFPLSVAEDEYKKFPALYSLTWRVDKNWKNKLKQFENNGVGWSTEGIFYTNDGQKFENEKDLVRTFRDIFGNGDSLTQTKDQKIFMAAAREIALKNGKKARWFSNEYPIVVLVYLPTGGRTKIDNLSNMAKHLFEKHKIAPNLETICVNSIVNEKTAKEDVLNAVVKAKNNKKEGVVVFLGRQLKLAVSLPQADFVVLMDNSKEFDSIFQTFFRCLTEDVNKTVGFVFDINIQRQVNIIYDIAHKTRAEGEKLIDCVKRIIKTKIVNFQSNSYVDDFFNFNPKEFDELIKKMDSIRAYCLFKEEEPTRKLIERDLSLFLDNPSATLKYFQTLFAGFSPEMAENIENGVIKTFFSSDSDVQSGVVKGDQEFWIKNEDEELESVNPVDKAKKQINWSKIMPNLAILLCLLTIRQGNLTEFDKMCDFLHKNKKYEKYLLNQINLWWSGFLKKKFNGSPKWIKFKDLYLQNYAHSEMFTRYVEEFKTTLHAKHNINNLEDLNDVVENNWKPSKYEKEQLSEITTPKELRREMLNKIPNSFWTEPNTVLEPSCGKGSFVIDCILRFMEGLKNKIPDKKKRYKFIVEKLIYFADINTTNIWMTRMLLDPGGATYKLNYYEGNTLKLVPNKVWRSSKFDLILTNPPYEKQGETGDNKLYLDFIKWSLRYSKPDALLLFITPINIKNYLTNQKNNRSYINNFLQIKFLSINTANRFFPTINNYFCYFLIKNSVVKKCKTIVRFVRNKIEEESTITLYEKQNIPLCVSTMDFDILNKTSNVLQKRHQVFQIKKASYNGGQKQQRIRKHHLECGTISKTPTKTHKYRIINKINKGNPFPGIFYYNSIKMDDYSKPKIIMSSGGYLLPSLDEKGTYNISDNMLYMLSASKKECEGLNILSNSLLVKYLNKITMTDNIHGRDEIIKKIRKVNLQKIRSDNDVFLLYGITSEEKELILKTLNLSSSPTHSTPSN